MAAITVQENNTLSINGNTISLNNGTNTISVTATHPDDTGCEKQVNIEVYKCYSGVITDFKYTINGTPKTQSFSVSNSVNLTSGQSIEITGVEPNQEVSGEITYNPATPVVNYDTMEENATTIELTIKTVNGCTITKVINVNKIPESGGTFNPPSLLPGSGGTTTS